MLRLSNNSFTAFAVRVSKLPEVHARSRAQRLVHESMLRLTAGRWRTPECRPSGRTITWNSVKSLEQGFGHGQVLTSPLRGEACRRIGLWILTMGTLPITLPSALLRADDRAAIDFFEKSIRPLIAERCQSCHGEAKAKAGLRLTDRESLMKGGDSGPAVVPGT